ncbi:MAG TPA: hypothetical protein VLG49_02490 [Rhabdochlamydiaceae bacterium]|nr:hypothetical protein [Rhabdochlamydiaceae bacterium]
MTSNVNSDVSQNPDPNRIQGKNPGSLGNLSINAAVEFMLGKEKFQNILTTHFPVSSERSAHKRTGEDLEIDMHRKFQCIETDGKKYDISNEFLRELFTEEPSDLDGNPAIESIPNRIPFAALTNSQKLELPKRALEDLKFSRISKLKILKYFPENNRVERVGNKLKFVFDGSENFPDHYLPPKNFYENPQSYYTNVPTSLDRLCSIPAALCMIGNMLLDIRKNSHLRNEELNSLIDEMTDPDRSKKINAEYALVKLLKIQLAFLEKQDDKSFIGIATNSIDIIPESQGLPFLEACSKLSMRLQFSIAIIEKILILGGTDGLSESHLPQLIPENAFVNMQNQELTLDFDIHNQDVPIHYQLSNDRLVYSLKNGYYTHSNMHTVGKGLEVLTEGSEKIPELDELIKSLINSTQTPLKTALKELNKIQKNLINKGK